MRQRPRRRPRNRVRQSRSAPLRYHHAMRARSQRRPHNRSQIVRVLHTIEYDEQLRLGRDIVQPGTDFYLRPAPGTSATTMTARTPHHLTGRVLTGVALDGAPQRFTPIALTVPTDVAIEFDITWQADQSCTDIA